MRVGAASGIIGDPHSTSTIPLSGLSMRQKQQPRNVAATQLLTFGRGGHRRTA